MDTEAFLNEIQSDSAYADQMVYVHRQAAREARPANADSIAPEVRALMRALGLEQLYTHQAEAVRLAAAGKDVLVATGTASGKTLCYTLPILRCLRTEPTAKALMLFPTKALCQDQFRGFARRLDQAGLSEHLAGVFDGDTPSALRRRLRDQGTAIFSNPDMVHAALMPQHARWADFLSRLHFLVLDEMHVYSGIFGSNMALMLRRLFRLCEHYGSRPQVIACSATIANPRELGERLIQRPMQLVDRDGSPRGCKTYVLWNPPRIRATTWRSRRSANVEAHELMARLIAQGVPTITFSKARMTAEMIHRYVREKLQDIAPEQMDRITPYRGGYRPTERREIEQRLFDGELLGVSTTPALELGIDVGTLGACIVVGYPGTRASFFQQAGRAGRKLDDSVVFLIGLDTSVNQFVMSNPGYIFETCIERAVIEPENPFVLTGHLRCATHELALRATEVAGFGSHAETVLEILEENRKVKQIGDRWYHAAAEIPQHEVSLRSFSEANVLIQDADTGEVLGEVDVYDSEPLVHPEAIYMHLGETYRVLDLDLERNIATIKREEVDYYTQPLGGTDVHHIDQQLREKAFGTGEVYWGEVTAYFNTHAYEKIHFYELDAISVHGLDLPTMQLETMAFWIVPPQSLMEEVRRASLDAHGGLRGIGYATRMLLPLFMTCDTLDFSHTVGSVNSPWNAIFVYERYPHGIGFTEKAYEQMDAILPAVLENIHNCPCAEGCPCCVGKPLRQFTTWNVERGEANIPNKHAALMILEGLIGDGSNLTNKDAGTLTESQEQSDLRLRKALRRRLERMREPKVFHPIRPRPAVKTEYPEREADKELPNPDVARRAQRRRAFDRELHKRIAKKIRTDELDPHVGKPRPPMGMKKKLSNLRPTDFPGKPTPEEPPQQQQQPDRSPIRAGDELAARARKMKKKLNKKRGDQS